MTCSGRRFAAAAVIAWLANAGACIPHKPQRTFDYQNPDARLPAACQTIEIPATDACGGTYGNAASNSRVCTSIAELTSSTPAGDRARKTGACFAHELHKPVENGRFPHTGFSLHSVEFDDEGQPWNATRQDVTLERLRDELRRPALVALFVHGWKNDASICNGNLACFRDVLEILAKAESRFAAITGTSPRRVVGVYVAWRGGSLSAPVVKQLTFWGRKHTAHTIGDNGAVTAFIRRLREIVGRSREEWRARTRDTDVRGDTSMVMVGHSFGAAVLYSALGTSLNADAGAAIEDSYKRSLATAERQAVPQRRDRSTAQALVSGVEGVHVRSQGDLVVLVNPAMEASRFANMAQTSTLRFSERQTPILLTLASEGDAAVRYFFPFGQSFSTILRSARSRRVWFSMLEGLGMHKSYHTHRLVRSAEPEAAAQPRAPECGCSKSLGAHGDDLVARLEPYYREIARGRPPVGALRLASYQEFLYSRLEPLRDIDPNNPFLMVQVDRRVIGDHGDIFNPRFMDFLIEFTVRSELKRALESDYPQTLTGGENGGGTR